MTERSWLQASLRHYTLEDLVSIPLFALPLLPFLPVATAPSFLHQILNNYRIAIGDCDPSSIFGTSSWTSSDSSQHIPCKLPLFMIMLILAPYILVSSLVPGYNPNLGISVVGREFICVLRYWQSFLFYSSHLCSCGSTLGDHLLGCGHGPLYICHRDALI